MRTTADPKSVQEVEIKPTNLVAIRVWWAFIWRSVLFSFVAGSLFTMLLETVGRRSDWLADGIILVSAIVFFIIEVGVIRRVLSKRFGSFRIAILKQLPEPVKPLEKS